MMSPELLQDDELKKCVDFHGHLCPGLALGFVASREGLKELKAERSEDEEIVAIVETDACCVDAVQVMLGSTFGKGNFFYKDYGKVAMTFINRESEKALRICIKPGTVALSPRHRELIAKVSESQASQDEIKEFWVIHHAKAVEIINTPFEKLFELREVEAKIPAKAKIQPSEPCARCGEPTMMSKMERVNGEKICAGCVH